MYKQTIKTIVSAFSYLFSDLKVNDYVVPLRYKQKSKLVIERETANTEVIINNGLSMSYELIDIRFANERTVNTLLDIEYGETNYSYNRIPYDYFFKLYINAKTMDDALNVLEQIIPYFAPHLTIRIDDDDVFKNTDLPIILTDVSHDVTNNLGELNSTTREINFELSFTVAGYVYRNTEGGSLIDRTNIVFKEINA